MRYLFLRRILLNMRPHAPTLLLHYYICVLLLSKACVILRRILLHDMRPHAPTLLLYYMCVLILGLVWSASVCAAASCYICVLMPPLLHYYICVLLLGKVCVILRRILQYMRPHATTTILLCVRSHTSCTLNVCAHISRILVVH
jgi:hypothetical protein